jgi:hypothetical protein
MQEVLLDFSGMEIIKIAATAVALFHWEPILIPSPEITSCIRERMLDILVGEGGFCLRLMARSILASIKRRFYAGVPPA